MNKKNKLLVIILLLLIIAIILLIVLYNIKKEKNINNDYIDTYPQKPEERYTKIKQKYESNEFTFQSVDAETLILMYFNKYKSSVISNNIEYAYNFLDKEYREKRFENIEEYKAYIENNIENITESVPISYQIKKEGDNNRYICIDNFGNYYIFNETAVMDFTVILDTYTINLPEFTEKYDTATDEQKVALNIDRFVKSINDKNYKYAYNCLADSYKNNYFKTQQDFENYAKENLPENITVGYKEFNTQGDVYTYSVILTNAETNEQINKTFIMQLGEGTEFVLSFDV